MSKRKPKLSWSPDPSFPDGTIWDLFVNGEPQSSWWVVTHHNGSCVGRVGPFGYTEEVHTMQEAAKLLLKEYKALNAR